MQQNLTANHKRIGSIDFLRGLIMIIMALDHSRDFFHKNALTGDPLDPSTTTAILYFTRWITHFCAPGFVFLSGLSAWMQGLRKTKKELCWFLVSRGLWLIFIDLTVMSLVLTADIHLSLLVLETLWSLGAGMIVLGLIIRLPLRFILLTGLLIVFGHNLIDFAETSRLPDVPVWWHLLHLPDIIPLSSDHSLFIFYPFLPWAGLMLVGYCAGTLFSDMQPHRRKKILLWIGCGAIVFFMALRAANIYGDPVKWMEQKNILTSFFSFMKVQKYPPSLLFICITIGPLLVFLALIKDTNGRLAKIISIYGRVPFFYFIVHFAILHLVQVITYLARGHSLKQGMIGIPGLPFKFAMPGEGYSLLTVYGIWTGIVIVMYPLCKWYDAYKTNHKEKWWLAYL